MKRILFVFLVLSNYLSAQVITNVSFIKNDNKYYASNVSINGEKIEGFFLLDTGSETFINKSLANKLNLEIKGETMVTDGQVEVKVPLSKAQFKIDNVSFPIIQIQVDENDIYWGSQCNVVGIIGNDLMRYFAWHFSKDTIQIIKKVKRFKNVEDYKKYKLDLQMGYYPILITSFGKPRATTLFDIGDNAFFEIGRSMLEYIPSKEIKQGEGVLTTSAFSKDISTTVVKTDIFEIEDFSVKNPIAFVSDGEGFWNLGAEFLDFFYIILDFPKKKYYLKQRSQVYCSDYWNNFGFKYEIKDSEKMIVSFIWNGSQAQEKGLVVGDEILSINQIDIKKLLERPVCEIRKLVDKELKKENLTITIKKESGNKIPIFLKRENIFGS